VRLFKKVVTEPDRWRLTRAIEAARSSWRTFGPHLDWLAAQLRDAHVVPADTVGEDVVTMNSRIDVEDVRTRTPRQFTLVYPDDVTRAGEGARTGASGAAGASAAAGGKLSVFDPAGLALLGMRVGDFLFWTDPAGQRTGRIARLLYQPEAAGDYER
jgi:regulator of nucleoside diphosphate kinase